MNKHAFTTHLTNRTILKVAGSEARAFLQGLLSNDMDDVTEHQAGFGTLLTPQGKILHEFFLVEVEDGFLLDCHNAYIESLMKRLKLYKLRADITLTDMSDSLSVGAIIQPGKHCQPDENKDFTAFTDPRLADLGQRVIAEMDQLETIFTASQLPMEDQDAYDSHTIQLGIASLGHSFGAEDAFLLDVNYDCLGAVSYKKGCFIGQEVTSRMKRKGQVRKRTLIVEGTAPLKAETQILDEKDTMIGTILSAAQNKGLAIVRLDRLGTVDHADLHVGGQTVTLTMPAYLNN